MDDSAFVIFLIRSQEICKCKELFSCEFLIDFSLHAEALDGDIVDGIDDCVFILIIDELIAEDTFALVPPQSDSIELRLEVFDSIGLHYGFFLDLQDSLKGSGQLTHVEQVVELGGGREHELLHELPELDGCRCQVFNDSLDLVSEAVILGVQTELESHDRAVDALDGERQDHVEDEELSFQSVGNVITASSGVVHGTDI